MQVTNLNIFEAKDAMTELIQVPFPVGLSYKLSKLAAKIGDQFALVNGVRNGLVRKYGKPGENGKIAVPQNGENWEAFQAELKELLDEKVDVEIEKIRLPDKATTRCSKCNEITDTPFMIEPAILLALAPFIEVLGEK